MAKLKNRITLQKNRFQLIQHVTEFDEDDLTLITRQFINTRLEILKQNWTRFQAEHEELCRSQSETLSEHQYIKTRIFECCQKFYTHARAKLLPRRDDFEVTIPVKRSVVTDTNAPVPMSRRFGALPKITLLRFSSNLQEWRSFHDLLISLIRNNTELSDVEKIHYLKTSLSDDALRFITNISNKSFSVTWDTLLSRYENK